MQVHFKSDFILVLFDLDFNLERKLPMTWKNWKPLARFCCSFTW